MEQWRSVQAPSRVEPAWLRTRASAPGLTSPTRQHYPGEADRRTAPRVAGGNIAFGPPLAESASALGDADQSVVAFAALETRFSANRTSQQHIVLTRTSLERAGTHQAAESRGESMRSQVAVFIMVIGIPDFGVAWKLVDVAVVAIVAVRADG